MKLQEMRDALSFGRGDVVLSRDRLGAAMGTFLDTYFNGQNITISDPVLQAQPADDQAVVFTGRSTALGVADLPITARLSLDEDGNVKTRLSYKLRGSAPDPSAWTFSRSFPKLPPVWNYETGYPINDSGIDLEPLQKPYVDSLDLFDTELIVVSHAESDAARGVSLEPGYNFVSKMRPEGMVGVLGYALSGGEPLSLYGTIRIPKPGDRTLVENTAEIVRPLRREDAYGIHLRAPLPLDFKIGKLSFEQPMFLVYTPASTDWMDENSAFMPAHGYSGRLSIPSAGITLDLSADLEWGLPRATLFASCEGVTLGKLTHLLDLCGTGDLSSSLPDPLRNAVEKLEKLELMAVMLRLSAIGLTPSIDAVSCTIGMPDLSWKVWGDHLVVQGIWCRFDVIDPFTSGKSRVAVTVSGELEIEGVLLSVSARSDNGFTVFAHIGGETIPIERLFKKLAPGAPAPSDLSIGTLSIVVAPQRFYSVQMLAATGSKPFVIPVGRSNLKISNIMIDLSYPQGGPVAGSFAGTAALGKTLQLTVRYSIPGDIMVRGVFRDIRLTHIIDDLCDLTLAMPPKFDLTIAYAAILVQKRGSDYVFNLGATVDGFGSFAFEVRKVEAQWGFAAGLDLETGGLSKIQGLSALKPIEDVVKLDRLMLIVSSFDGPSFQFPSLAQLNAPQLAAKDIALPAVSPGVAKGLTVFAEWQLDPGDQKHSLLMKLLGLGARQSITLVISTPDPSAGSRLFFRQRAKINGLPFEYQLGVMLQSGKVSMFLVGSMQVEIQGQKQTFDTTMAFVPTGAFMSATMKGSAPVDCGAFKLSNLALQIGVNWGGIPSLGIACTIDTKRFSSSIAILFDSTNPAASLFAGSISDLTLKDIADTLLGGILPSSIDDVLEKVALVGTSQVKLAGDLADALDGRDIAAISAAFAGANVVIPSSSEQILLRTNKSGESWHITDLTKMRHYAVKKIGNDIVVSVDPQLYLAPQKTFIGTLAFPQGYYVNAGLDIFGFRAYATVDISVQRGFSVDGQMDKIVLVNENVFSLAAAKDGGGPKVSISTMARPEQPTPELRQPHFLLNGEVMLLGLEVDVYASVSVKGLALAIKGPLAPGVVFDLDAEVGKTGMIVNGDILASVGTIDLGDLGKIKLDTDVEGSLGVRVDGQTVKIAMEGSFELLGDEIKIGRFALRSSPNALKKVGKNVEKKVAQELRKAFKDVNRWTKAMSDGMVDGVEDTEKVLKKVFKKSDKEAKEMAKDIRKGAGKGVKKVEKKAKKFGKKLNKMF